MAAFKEGCVVLYRPTQSLYTVVRWDRDAEVLLLTPAGRPSAVNRTTAAKERARTRWVFETMVDAVVETTTAPPGGVTTKRATAGDGTAAPTERSGGKASASDPTPYARRAAKLDRRVEFRRHPKHGRGLFALRDIPEGTEVMRVPAAAAVLSGREAEGSCAGCFLPIKAMGRLDPCRGCPLRFCARCKKDGLKANGAGGGAGHNGGTCELTKEFLGMCATTPEGSGPPDEGVLRLVADLLVRRRAGVISDEEWDLVKSLESDDNEARAMSLPPSELQKCARLLKSLVGIDVSHEDLQCLYRRVTRNLHTVAPNATATSAELGSVAGLFPCGALVNHSCLPNSCFHCVAATSSSVDGPPVIEQVLRTFRSVRAGDELCYSYISAVVAKTVSQRHGLLEGWGFRCACKRCQREAEEDIRLETHPTPVDACGLGMVRLLEQIIQHTQRNAAPPKEEECVRHFEEIAQFLAMKENLGLSPLLASRIAIYLREAIMLVGAPHPLLEFSACGHAADAFSKIGSPLEISARMGEYTSSTKLDRCEGLSESQRERLQYPKAVGIEALRNAARLHELFYGEEHELSITLRKRVEAIVRR